MSPVRPIGPRLETLATLVPFGARVADIGADHGDLTDLLLCQSRVEFCVASEKLESRMSRLNQLKARFPQDPRLVVRWGEGLSALRPSDRIDTVIVAGMGARTIQAILSRPLASIQTLVLQPQTETSHLRAWLDQAGWTLSDERLRFEGAKGYEMLQLCRGKSPEGLWQHPMLSRDELEQVGPHLVREKSAETLRFWLAELERVKRNFSAAQAGERPPAELRAKVERAQRIVDALESA